MQLYYVSVSILTDMEECINDVGVWRVELHKEVWLVLGLDKLPPGSHTLVGIRSSVLQLRGGAPIRGASGWRLPATRRPPPAAGRHRSPPDWLRGFAAEPQQVFEVLKTFLLKKKARPGHCGFDTGPRADLSVRVYC
jgi:hypothetical protein